MSERYEGRQVVGIDLHRRRSVIVRMTGTGTPLETVQIVNTPESLTRVMSRAGEHPEVVLESCYRWYWAADTLAAAGAHMHLAHPLGVKAFSYRRVCCIRTVCTPSTGWARRTHCVGPRNCTRR